MQILKAGALYFALAFGAGFVLGTIRVLWAVPRFGERTAELMETPIYAGCDHYHGKVGNPAACYSAHTHCTALGRLYCARSSSCR